MMAAVQQIICRYGRDAAAAALGHSELRNLFLDVAKRAGIPLAEGQRALRMGPALPPGATSEAERFALDLREPRDPSEVAQRMSGLLPPGLRLEGAWIAQRGKPEENIAHLDEAVYLLEWQGAPAEEELSARLLRFMQATVVGFTRVREKKVQQLNARALVQEADLLESRDGLARLRVAVSVGPQGSLRPAELLQALGYAPEPGAVRVHRIALQYSGWRAYAVRAHAARWRRRNHG